MLPFVIDEPISGLSAEAFSTWLSDNADDVQSQLGEHGALLFRGARIAATADFELACRTLTPDLKSYIGGGSPRSRVDNAIYTSTEYSASVSIPLHCEGSYLAEMPRHVWFYCHKPSQIGGQTPLCDMRSVAARLPQEMRDTWAEKGITYISNLHDGRGFGKSWAETYETEDKHKVERILDSQGADYAWTDAGLRVLLNEPALRPRDRDGALIWVNQAVNWHPAHLGASHMARMKKLFGAPENAPKHARFGDGTEIPDSDIEACAAALEAEEQVFVWQQGDVLLIDNQVIAHGRQPFEGERAIYVALA
ncbi:MAG: TauD/TfdA family dioxygenase [Pseudomonadota bacterium]